MPGGVVSAVEAGSAADAAGLVPGDRLASINGHPLRDVIDVQFYSAEERLEFVVERAGTTTRLQAEREYGQALGLSFQHPTFDVDVRRCANNCDFCFVKQNAPGMRRSLYVKDDDYRYSFLSGSFVTLTNLTEEDWARLEEQRLSPLYVSVHASDAELRRRFLGGRAAPDVMAQLRRLARLGIEVHAQVVLVPGLNDGDHLARTVADLTELHGEPVLSVSVVPIGLTKYHRGACRGYTPEESRVVLEQVEAWRRTSRARLGRTFVYPSDEWYLVAGRDLPPAAEYDGFPQVENGVGMVRQFVDEWEEIRSEVPRRPGVRATLACGTLIAPVLDGLVAELSLRSGAVLKVVPVVNGTFGAITTVSGLLAGADVLGGLRGERLGGCVFLPRAMFTGRYGAGDAAPGTTLDDHTADDLARELGVGVEMAGSLGEVVSWLAGQPSGEVLLEGNVAA